MSPTNDTDTSTRREARRPERVKMRLVDNLTIQGTLHVREEYRLSDAMNDSSLEFLALTDVRVADSGGRTIEETGFLSVNRAQIKYICADEDIQFRKNPHQL